MFDVNLICVNPCHVDTHVKTLKLGAFNHQNETELNPAVCLTALAGRRWRCCRTSQSAMAIHRSSGSLLCHRAWGLVLGPQEKKVGEHECLKQANDQIEGIKTVGW
jgi:hypothetical protein